MNSKHLGTNVMDTIKEWKKDSKFVFLLEQEKEKTRIATLLKNARKDAGITQDKLAKMSGIKQSVIARIEGRSCKSVPRLDLFSQLLWTMGYKTYIGIRKAA
jgi:ribosome-binding protein aMBF1 (putative translation factor)